MIECHQAAFWVVNYNFWKMFEILEVWNRGNNVTLIKSQSGNFHV